MKLAKFSLIVTALFAIVGGVFALKNRNTQKLFFTTAGTTRCTWEHIAVSTVTMFPNQEPISTLPVPLATTSGICTTTTFYYLAN